MMARVSSLLAGEARCSAGRLAGTVGSLGRGERPSELPAVRCARGTLCKLRKPLKLVQRNSR